MAGFRELLGANSHYRRLWLAQIVSEVGDHFNTIAVVTLTLHITDSGLAVGGVMLSRVLPAMVAGPIAGVILDRFDRKRVMVASDLVRALVAAGFVLAERYNSPPLLYILSALLMFASPFFTAGRMAILPRITTPGELHTANALTQTTAWLTLTIGTMLGGVSTMKFGYGWAFLANAISFLVSAMFIQGVRSPEGHFRALGKTQQHGGWADFAASVRYITATPLVLAIGLTGVGWASGGGAAQVLFTMYGERVFNAGAAGVGFIWGFAGVGLVLGGLLGHQAGPRLRYKQYKRFIGWAFLIHGLSYVAFSQAPVIGWAMVAIALSRACVGMINVINRTILLTHVPDAFRGRVFANFEMLTNTAMMASLMGAGAASKSFGLRQIGFVAGCLSASTAVFWLWANWTGRLPEPRRTLPETEEEPTSTVQPA
ncbi:MAG: MFS transporter [Bryobacterales bacterium]|nr:MFS transporter [Bryobacterales bacterium]